jgi:hypothetical protein
MNFIWNPHKATLLMPVTIEPIPEAVLARAKKEGLVKKSECHLTILSFQNGKKLLQQDRVSLEEIFALATSFDWSYSPLPQYALLERTIPEFVLNGQVQTPRHTRRSIVQFLDVPSLTMFMQMLSVKTGISFDTPLPHVTLFTWSDYEPEMESGIALNSEADFKKYVQEKISL